jgi:hypothetical protein
MVQGFLVMLTLYVSHVHIRSLTLALITIIKMEMKLELLVGLVLLEEVGMIAMAMGLM